MGDEKRSKSEIATREEETLAFWNANDIFKKSLNKNAVNGAYVFYDGPPFATGLPHYGHIVASVIKDAIPRYWTMRGYYVPRVWGWDCHGLPIENIVEKELGFKHKKDIVTLGVAKFNELCRSKVMTYAEEWKKVIPRVGRWADMDEPYFTMSKDFMESVWWAFKQLYDKGLVYEDYRSMHICPRCETTLSQTEVSEGYKDVKDLAVTVKFKVRPGQHIGSFVSDDRTFILAWTTTPWTLPGNVALAVGPSVEYKAVNTIFETGGDTLIVARNYNLLQPQTGPSGQIIDLEYFKGADLEGVEYKPPFDYYINDTDLKNHENGWKVYAADFVTAEDGTGIAHEAPAFGADDWTLSKKYNLPFIQHVAMDGTFKPEVKDFAGEDLSPRAKNIPEEVREVDLNVKKYLEQKGLLFHFEKYLHAYPHCWRCDTPLLNYATSSWFVKIEEQKEALLRNAEPINWSPDHIKNGRWGKWLEGARDWSISRQRFWASVMPIWKCENCKSVRVFGSASELEEASGAKVDDLHKHIVDEITLPCECGGAMHRIPDVLDTWFDSGSMPYGQVHYPFENKEQFEKTFPAQFIAEGQDQTRAWFYYLHIFATSIFGKAAFENVIVNGIVLAEDGKKMSKKLQNYPDPMEVVDRYGADALRFYLLSSPVVQAENLSFSERGVDEIAKKNIGRLGNVLAFYQLYDSGVPRDWKSTNILDIWILARLEELIREATDGFESYRLDTAVRPVSSFIDDLSAWYLRRSRDRFKANDDPSTELGASKEVALATLRYVLHTLSRVIAPSMPFFAEHVFQTVREEEDEESVHLATWPEAESVTANPDVLAAMRTARDIVTLALEAREKAGIKVRQPLQKLIISSRQLVENTELRSIIAEEINVKNVIAKSDLGEDMVELDTTMTDELKEEGVVRETVREVQAFRKDQNLHFSQKAKYRLMAEHKDYDIVKKHIDEIERATNTTIIFE